MAKNRHNETQSAVDPAAVRSLRQALKGSAYLPGDEEYDSARATWDRSITHSPAIVVMAERPEDAVAAVRFARASGLTVGAQGTGHGAIFGCDGLLLNMCRMKDIVIDPEAQTARVEAGVVWGEVIAAAAQHGLAGLCGSSPGVGVVGYTLGGGTGWLARKYGYACDSLISAEIVTGDGRLLHASEQENADLFWALRGGGGRFGAVTALEFRLYPIAEVYGGSMYFPVERAREVLNVYSNWTRYIPETMTSAICIQHLPDAPFLPEPVRGKSFVVLQGCLIGDAEQGAYLLSPLRNLNPLMDDFRMMPYSEIGGIAREPVDPMPSHIGTETLRELSPCLIDSIVDKAGDRNRTALSVVAIRHIGGAYAQLSEDVSAAPRLTAPFVLLSVGLAIPQIRDKVVSDTDALLGVCRPHRAGPRLFNFLGAPGRERDQHHDLFSPEKADLLETVKERYDPHDVFRFGMPVGRSRAVAA